MELQPSNVIATENSKELTEFFRNTWTKEQYEKFAKLDELAEYNMEINKREE
jgi:hypothetical protein